MKERLSPSQLQAIESAVRYGDPTHHLRGMAAFGGWQGTRAALRRKDAIWIARCGLQMPAAPLMQRPHHIWEECANASNRLVVAFFLFGFTQDDGRDVRAALRGGF